MAVSPKAWQIVFTIGRTTAMMRSSLFLILVLFPAALAVLIGRAHV